jgi:hypothetical protein
MNRAGYASALKLHNLLALSQNLQPRALDLGSDELDARHPPTLL